MPQSPVQVATTPDGGCVVRIVGRATMQDSPTAEELVIRTLEHSPTTRVVIDLSGCDYLDSTFLGSLFGLYSRFGGGPSPRVRFHAPASIIKKLFGPLKLDKHLVADSDNAPAIRGQWVDLPASKGDKASMSRHVMECHRRLAEIDTPARAAFTKIADAMERELEQC